MIKKYVYHGHDFDRTAFEKELGDVAYYLAMIAWDAGIPLEKVFQTNIDKLRARYPEGFSRAASVERKDVVL